MSNLETTFELELEHTVTTKVKWQISNEVTESFKENPLAWISGSGKLVQEGFDFSDTSTPFELQSVTEL